MVEFGPTASAVGHDVLFGPTTMAFEHSDHSPPRLACAETDVPAGSVGNASSTAKAATPFPFAVSPVWLPICSPSQLESPNSLIESAVSPAVPCTSPASPRNAPPAPTPGTAPNSTGASGAAGGGVGLHASSCAHTLSVPWRKSLRSKLEPESLKPYVSPSLTLNVAVPEYEKPFDGVVQQLVGPAFTSDAVVVPLTTASSLAVTRNHACSPV